jgi:uncharacterized protein (DUF1800 family)
VPFDGCRAAAAAHASELRAQIVDERAHRRSVALESGIADVDPRRKQAHADSVKGGVRIFMPDCTERLSGAMLSTVAAPMTTPSTSYRPAGSLDATTALHPYAGPWNRRLAAHLLRRAGFGGSPADVDRLTSLGPAQAAATLVRFADAPAETPPLLQPQLVAPPGFYGKDAMMDDTTVARRKSFQMQNNVIRRENLIALQTWWLERMIATPTPLQEKMVLFWHGHFTSSPEKGTTEQELLAQNQLFRSYALGNVRELTLHVSQDPAMLRYLDNNVNVKAHPNENYARELMELFTLGIGNYTEQDVRESARAFTGWNFRRNPDDTGTFFANPRQHDNDPKTFLHQTGNFEGSDVVRIIFAQPACARFFATKLLAFFVYDDPEPALVDQVAALLRQHDFELRPVMATLFASNVFYSPRAYRALVKSPVEFVVGTHQLFNVATVGRPGLGALRAMGQVLFYPPNVKGWDGGAAWLNSQTVLTRENFANAIAQNPQMTAEAAWIQPTMRTMDPQQVAFILTDTMLQGDCSRTAQGQLVAYLSGSGQSALAQLSVENIDERVRGAAYLTMAMPAYQLA